MDNQVAPAPPEGFNVPVEPVAPPPPAGFDIPVVAIAEAAPPPPEGFDIPVATTAPTSTDTSGMSEFRKGFQGTLIGGNATNLGNAAEGFGVMLDHPGLLDVGKNLQEWGKQRSAGFEAKVPSFTNIKSFDDVLSYAGYGVGSALASSAPSAVAGLGVGAMTTNPIAGIVAGAAGPSYVQNYGDLYGNVRDDKDIQARVQRGETTPAALAQASAVAAVPMAALDVFGLGKVLGSTVFAEAKKDLVRRVVSGMAKGSLVEGTTEGMQEVISQWAQHYLGSQTEMKEKVIKVADNALIGGLGGGTIGGAGGVVRPRGNGPLPPLEQIAAAAPTAPEGFMPVEAPLSPVSPTLTILPDFTVGPMPVSAPSLLTPPEPAALVVSPVFYSNLQRVVQEKLPESGSPEQMLATIRNASGVKEEELAATGLTTFIAGQEGRVSKQDVMDHLAESQIKVTEVVRGAPGLEIEGLDPTAARYTEYNVPGPYTEPRNLILTLPPPAWMYPGRRDAPSAAAAAEVFKTAHWSDIVNPLVHAITNVRVDDAGNKMVFVEGIQSDWHQRGADVGYRGRQPQIQYIVKEQDGRFGIFNQSTKQLVGTEDTRETAQAYATRLSENPALVPDAPFKTTWLELGFKRVLRWAADAGVSRVGLITGDQAIRAMQVSDPKTMQFLRTLYDVRLPSIAKKWAKNLGGTFGKTDLVTMPLDPAIDYQYGQVTEEVPYVEIPERGRSRVQQGLPLFSQLASGESSVSLDTKGAAGLVANEPLYANAVKVAGAIQEYIKQFKFESKVRIQLVNKAMLMKAMEGPQGTRIVAGFAERLTDGTYLIQVDLGMHKDPSQLFATMVHEFGHTVMWEKFARLPLTQQQEILTAYNNFRSGTSLRDTLTSLWNRRDNAAILYSGRRGVGTAALQSLSPETLDYWTGFDEWFAEQVARWATTGEKPLGIAERALANLGKVLRLMHEFMAKKFGMTFRAEPVMQEWLNSFIQNAPKMGFDINEAVAIRTQRENQRALTPVDAGLKAVPQQGETADARQMLASLFDNVETPPQLREMAAHADSMSRFHKYMLDLTQLANLNPSFTPLLRYVERMREIHLEEARIFDAALGVGKAWRRLGNQAENVTALIDDVANMVYRTDEEVANGVARYPTQQEFAALVAKHKVTQPSIKVFDSVRKMFDAFLTKTAQNAVEDARRTITNPQLLANRIVDITEQVNALRARPYFPFMRFGRHFVTVRDAAGNVTQFHTTERRGLRSAARMQEILRKELESKLQPGESIDPVKDVGVLPETAEQFVGLPPLLLEAMKEKLGLTDEQRDAVDQLLFKLSPAQSFRHRFQHKNYTPGYSMDFQRAFASYFFHGGRYYARQKYLWGARAEIAAARAVGGNKAGEIANFMQDHLDNTILNARGDYGILKGAIFFWAMAYVPAAATLNLTQTPMITLPFLAGKFGDFSASKALAKAMTDVTNFYKKGKYEALPQFEMQALDYGIKTGRITEAQASELAGMTQGNNLIVGLGGTKVQRGVLRFVEAGAKMFELAEQFNRRVAYRAALDLAQRQPQAKVVQEAVSKYNDEYTKLLSTHTEAQARAIVTAAYTVDQTQFVYARYARPRFMRSPLAGTIFVFKKYMQSVLTLLGTNKADVLPRYLFIAMLMGGMMGVPGAEDLVGIIKALAHHLFGKDFDVKLAAREWIKDFTNGKVPSDIILQGLARRGFGLPALVDMLGGALPGQQFPGRGLQPGPAQNIPAPVFDRSRALSMGNILPVDIGKMLGPEVKDEDKLLADETQKASGAVFGLGFNLYKFLRDDKLSLGDPKRWERAIPRALGDASKAYRAFSEGRERTRGGQQSAATVVPYDTRDTEQMMEILGLLGGYNNLRTAAKWDSIMALAEREAYYDLQGKGLRNQMFEAIVGGNKEEIGRVRDAIVHYNQTLPTEARGKAITSDSLRQSLQARQRDVVAKEAGVPIQRSNVPLARHIQGLFPEAQPVDARRVR
jgi:hypothetical protein